MGPRAGGDPVYATSRFLSIAQVMQAVPVASAAVGAVAGFPAARLAASHFSVMTRDTAQVLIGGPALVERVGELTHAWTGNADEVVASHGATVGQLDEQAVFYLRTRGLSEHDARQMLTTAFCRSVSDRLPDAVLAEAISARMMDVMPQAK